MEVGYDLSAIFAAAYRQPIAVLSHTLIFGHLIGDLYHMGDEGQFVFG